MAFWSDRAWIVFRTKSTRALFNHHEHIDLRLRSSPRFPGRRTLVIVIAATEAESRAAGVDRCLSRAGDVPDDGRGARALRWPSKVPGNRFWELLCHHQSHVEWVGCSLHDMIQPSFSFLVGVALPFSLASRLARGQSKAMMTAHALWRSLILVFLGVFLRSRNSVRPTSRSRIPSARSAWDTHSCSCWRSSRRRVQWLALADHPGRLLGGLRALSAARPRI